MIRDLVVTLSFLSMPAAVAVIVGGTAAPFLATGGQGGAAAVEISVEPAAPPDWTEARRAFSARCAACHGGHGEGGADAPSLIGPLAGDAPARPGSALGHGMAARMDEREAAAIGLFLEKMRAANAGLSGG